MRLYLQLFVCLMTFLVVAGCGGGSKMCTVGLTLKPGESCRYTDNDDDFSFDIEFSAIDGGAKFPRVYVKSPDGTFGPTGGPAALHGGNAGVTIGDKTMIKIDSSTAKICSGQGLNQKCFTARSNSDGSWTITAIPLPPKNVQPLQQ